MTTNFGDEDFDLEAALAEDEAKEQLVPITIEQFLRDRIADSKAFLKRYGDQVSLQMESFYSMMEKTIDWHENWPVLTATPIQFEPALSDSIDEVIFRATQQITYMTKTQYRNSFMNEPPTDPLLKMWATMFSWHPQFNPEWEVK